MMFKTCVLLGAAALLTACGAAKIREAPAREDAGAASQRAAAAEAAEATAAAAAYRIDPAQSELRILVHRAGTMARLGHNHVIVDRAIGGWVRFTGDITAAAFAFRVPVAELVVDAARARSEEGPDFAEEVADDAKSGTRRNMLGAQLLDAGHFPDITVTSIAVKQAPGSLTAVMTVNVAGHESTLAAPFTLDLSQRRIAASGSVRLRQSALGLTPFSVLLGALQVQDEITVKFTLVALAG